MFELKNAILMDSDYEKYIIDYVKNSPGRYSPEDIIKQIRSHGIDIGEDDPGLARARNIFFKILRDNKIIIKPKNSIFGYDRCFPV